MEERDSQVADLQAQVAHLMARLRCRVRIHLNQYVRRSVLHRGRHSRSAQASRDISMSNSSPAWPIVTSVTRRRKPGQSFALAAERPRSSSITRTRPGAHPAPPATRAAATWTPRDRDLLPGRLPDVDHSEPVRCRPCRACFPLCSCRSIRLTSCLRGRILRSAGPARYRRSIRTLSVRSAV